MHTQQRQQTLDLLKSKGIQSALFTAPESVKWITGFAPHEHPFVQNFVGGPLLLWVVDGQFHLLVIDPQSPYTAEFAKQPNSYVHTYHGISIQEPLRSAANLAQAFANLLQTVPPAGQVGAELNGLTGNLWQVIFAGGKSATPIDGWLQDFRAIKTEEEIAKLRRAFDLTGVGHQTARQVVRIGASEIDVWTAVRSAMERAAGHPLGFGNDVISNVHAVNIGDYPTATALAAGNMLTVDLSANYQNYWSDSCMTYFVSEPTPDQLKAERVVQEALEMAISLVKPGVKANAIDQQTRAFMEKNGYPVYPHHTGHGVGVAPHESPRIVPYNEEVLQPNMVIMLEPGIYIPHQISIRHEHAVLVTSDGAEVLTKHDMRGWVG